MSLKSRLNQFLFVTLRIRKYKLLSDCKSIQGKPLLHHPALLKGNGSIIFKNNVQIGVVNSPGFYSGYTYLEARNNESIIVIGNNVAINNVFSAVAFTSIIIDDNVLIGDNCSISDTDGHFLQPDMRNIDNPPALPVHIMNNVFIGSNVTILKGVSIGENSVIGNNAVVTKSIPANVIAAGNPARVIRSL